AALWFRDIAADHQFLESRRRRLLVRHRVLRGAPRRHAARAARVGLRQAPRTLAFGELSRTHWIRDHNPTWGQLLLFERAFDARVKRVPSKAARAGRLADVGASGRASRLRKKHGAVCTGALGTPCDLRSASE